MLILSLGGEQFIFKNLQFFWLFCIYLVLLYIYVLFKIVCYIYFLVFLVVNEKLRNDFHEFILKKNLLCKGRD